MLLLRQKLLIAGLVYYTLCRVSHLSLTRCFILILSPSVCTQQGELGGAVLRSGLPPPHAGLYEVALRHIQH